MIVVFAGMPLPIIICPTLGGVKKEALETVLDPVVVVAPRLAKVNVSAVAVPVALAERVSVFDEVLTEVM